MTELNLDNTSYGGSQNITFGHVLDYIVAKRDDHAVKSIPGKALPTVDVDTIVTFPRTFRIETRITSAERANLRTMRSERTYIHLTDTEETDIYTRMTGLTFRAAMGFTKQPWIANINLIGLTS